MRCGIGYDIHRISYTSYKPKIWLGGILIPTSFSLIGHSDTDILLHAITDALLGALGLGDIGLYFPDTESKNHNIASSYFLEKTKQQLLKEGYQINNLDCNIICEKPKITQYREKIQNNIASLLKILPNQINIKGKTNERLDAVGKEQAIVCQVIVLISQNARSKNK